MDNIILLREIKETARELDILTGEQMRGPQLRMYHDRFFSYCHFDISLDLYACLANPMEQNPSCEELKLFSKLRMPPRFMELEHSLQRSQEHALVTILLSCSSTTSALIHVLFLSIHFNIIL